MDFARRFFFDEAIRELNQAVKLDPKFALAYLQLARIYFLQGDGRKVQELVPKIKELQSRLPREYLLQFQASEAFFSGDEADARKILETLLKEFPRASEARTHLSVILRNMGEVDQAISLLKAGLQLDPRNEDLLNELGYAEESAGDLKAALQANDQYMAVRPNDPNPWDSRGDYLYAFNHDDEAVAAYRKVIELKPDFTGYRDYVKLAIVYADQKKFDLANSALQEYARRASSSGKFDIVLFQGQFLETRGDLQGAQASYERAVREMARAGQNQVAGDTLMSIANLAILTGQGMDSALAFARQQKLGGHEYEAIGLLEAAQGDRAASERSLQLRAALPPQLSPHGVERARNFYLLVAAFVRKDAPGVITASGRLPASLDSMRQFPLGWAYFETKDYSKAEQALRAAIFSERTPGTISQMRRLSPLLAALAHFYLAQVHDATGKRDQAVNEYQDFLSHFDNSRAHLPQITIARAALQRSMQ
jgi:eukaryotic-like serine/threonine-protein kinase